MSDDPCVCGGVLVVCYCGDLVCPTYDGPAMAACRDAVLVAGTPPEDEVTT